jgi:hypothetical protein
MTAHAPILMDFGEVQVVAPNGWPQLTAHDWSDIEAALIVAPASDQAAGVVVGWVEARLGVNEAHRQAVFVGREKVLADIRRRQSQRERAEQDRVHQLLAPWRAPALDLKRVAKAERKAASDDPRQAKAGVDELTSLERARRARGRAMKVAADQAEIRTLAEGRGDVVEIESTDSRGHQGRIRLVNRDGLESLFKSGALTPIQYAAGMRYRDLYERVDPEKGLKPMDYAGVFSASHGGEGFAQKRSGWMRAMLNVETRIRNEDKNGVAVRALQEIAGNRRCISAIVTSGHARTKHTAGLILALDICADFWGLS